ncbi:MAG: carbon storage regulator [Planctomycetia bacterium]|nr:carbon storage regulator [Planctomycetia bacterium]
MLVLSRKVGERILIGENIAITVVRISQGTVRIGVEAPRDTSVIREEVVLAAENAPRTPPPTMDDTAATL